MTPLPLSPFIDDTKPRFKLDVKAFMAALEVDIKEAAPLFLSDPSPDYMRAAELLPICEIITRHATRAA